MPEGDRSLIASVGTGVFNFANPTPFDISSLYESAISFTAANNLSAAALLGSGLQVRSGDIAPVGGFAASGVLISSPASGTTGSAQVMGVAQVRAGGVIAKDHSLTVTGSGYWIHANSGLMVHGRALEASAAPNSGSTFAAVINFATPHYATSCLDICY